MRNIFNYNRLIRLAYMATLLLGMNAAWAGPKLDVEVKDGDGNVYSLSELKGQVVYLDFWASWCGPCRKSFPWMDQMHSKYVDQGLKVIAVNLDFDTALATQFLQQTPANFTIAYDVDHKVANEFSILGMPSSYLFNREGELVNTHVGFFSENLLEYEAELVRLLNESKK